jgi:hypothetical protein
VSLESEWVYACVGMCMCVYENKLRNGDIWEDAVHKLTTLSN